MFYPVLVWKSAAFSSQLLAVAVFLFLLPNASIAAFATTD